jgi:hypothetical protein
MKHTVVRYKTKPDTAQENEHLIKAVFEELRAKSPSDIRYLALRLNDGTFIHSALRRPMTAPVRFSGWRLFGPSRPASRSAALSRRK